MIANEIGANTAENKNNQNILTFSFTEEISSGPFKKTVEGYIIADAKWLLSFTPFL